MAEAKTGSRIRLPKVKLPTRGRGSAAAPSTSNAGSKEDAPTMKEDAPTREAPAKAASAPSPADTSPAATKAGGGSREPEPNMQERMEGLQGWMAEMERKQGRLTYFGGAALLIAILASGAALYFAITAKSDSSDTQDDIDALSTRIDGLQQAVTKNTEDTQQTLNSTVQQLQASIADLQRKQAQDAANISTLQSQVAAAAQAPRAGAGPNTSTTPGAAAAPGTTTKP